jgi:hypothetical protein
MKQQYSNRIITAEQFTDDYTPEHVFPATEEYLKVLTPGIRIEITNQAYVFIFPFPSETDKEVQKLLQAPKPFMWIKKGDYVITNPSGYQKAEEQSSFEENYTKIKTL